MFKKIALVLLVLMLANMAAAVIPTSVTITKADYSDACAEYGWTISETTATDFDANQLTVSITTNASGVTASDVNYPSGLSSLTVCSLTEGEWVNLAITPIDSNTDYGNYTGSAIDQNKWTGTTVNAKVTAGSSGGAARYLVFVILNTLAVFIGIIILVFLAVYAIAKMGIKIPGMRK